MSRVRHQANRVCQSGRTAKDMVEQRTRNSDWAWGASVARACDRFLASRGQTGGGMRDTIAASCATKRAESRVKQKSKDRIDTIASELESSWP